MADGTRARKPRKRGLPRGPQALPPEEVAADQRERLYEATIHAVNERGFVATTISDLVASAGVSRRSFYEHFENKEQCLLATYDALIGRLTARIAEAYHPQDEWVDQIEAIVRALFEASSDRPDAARLVSVEMGAAGPIGIERWARDAEQLTAFITSVFDRAPGEGTVPTPVARAIVGALRTILYSRVRRERSSRSLKAELQKLTPDIVTWITSFYPTPPEIPEKPRPRRHGHLQGGRAPGTLSPSPRWAPRGLPRGEHNLPRGFVAHNQRERIFDAVANLTAAKGYAALSLEEIVAEAAISLQTFYEHFENKEEAFLATFEMGHAKATAAINRSLNLRLSWAQNVRLGLSALLEFLASEPSIARLACVDILIAYPHVTGRVNEANFSYIELLDIGPEDSYPNMPAPVMREASVGGIFELLHEYILHGRTQRLPELIDYVMYIAITPFAGSEIAGRAVAET
ncbi:MAG TPA: TetR family transcriptional regulator [Solirubrobacteraceae bacterium]|jgi:AcrR family transcriptional regulator|nr:TetR family transcriptional regulator [Solirubrobacteraceae bacterium]